MRQQTRLIINVLSNYGSFLIYGIVNFFLVGYLARVLGKDVFGLAMLVLSFTMITELLGIGVSLALTKYLAANLVQKNTEKFHRLVNTSLIWFFICSIVGAIICVFLSLIINRISNIPPELHGYARNAMLLMAIKVFVCFPFNTFQGILWAYQRYDLTNLAKSVGIILRALLLLFWFKTISISITGLIWVTIISMLIERLMWFHSSYLTAEQITIHPKYISKQVLWLLLSFGGYVLVIQVSNLIGYEAVKWIVSAEMPVMEVGIYSLIATIAMFAGSTVYSLASVLMPAASNMHAQNQHDKKIMLAVLSTKYATILAGMFCIVPLFLLEPFLTLWVGKTYPSDVMPRIAIAAAILLCGQYIISFTTCLFQMTTGIGKVFFLAMVTLCWSIGGLAVVWGSLHWFSGTVVTVSIIISIARIVGAVVNLVYGIKVINIPAYSFIKDSLVKPTIVSGIICVIGYVLTQIMDVYIVPEFLLSCIILVTLYLIGNWVSVLSSWEKKAILSKMLYVFKKSAIKPS
ncbi:MAG TPA: MATE family efflux transporter [Anaerohalosphaeraceae bacterium]|nr:MATE family efflux transporter [Anaerohalosphaeraceae bacterium]